MCRSLNSGVSAILYNVACHSAFVRADSTTSGFYSAIDRLMRRSAMLRWWEPPIYHHREEHHATQHQPPPIWAGAFHDCRSCQMSGRHGDCGILEVFGQ